MEVNDILITKLADLARLQFSAQEKDEIRKDLQEMISFVDKLNDLNLADTEPMIFMSGTFNVLREDEVKGSISREMALKNAPDHDNVFFRVPKVIRHPKASDDN